MEKTAQNDFFNGLNPEQQARFFAAGELIELKKNSSFIQEGVRENTFYYILEGAVSIYIHSAKQDFVISTLLEGDTVGELALIDNAPRSASARTIEDSKLYKFDIDELRKDPELDLILNSITKKISEQLSIRLRFTNNITVAALEKKFLMSIFSVRMLILLSAYALSLNLIAASKQYFQTTTILSAGLIVIFVMVLFSVVRKSGYPLSFYGFTTQNLNKNIGEAILLSIPLMLLFLFLKWVLISIVPAYSHLTLFDPTSIFKDGAIFSFQTYFMFMFLYALLCPAQEFLVRGCMQTSLLNLLTGPTANRIKWKAIFISNLIFASAHSHTSTGFALTAFIPGLFWGWLFYRQKSLVGVSVSHIMLGVWSAFIVGFEKLT